MSSSLELSRDERTPTKLSEAVIGAVAKEESVDERKLDRPLFEVIDPDALDSLFHNSAGRVQFNYLGYTVTVDDNGTVDVAEAKDTWEIHLCIGHTGTDRRWVVRRATAEYTAHIPQIRYRVMNWDGC